MKNQITEESIIAKYKENKQKNESELSELESKKKGYEEAESIFMEAEKQHSDYINTFREEYAGTDELIRLNQFDENIYEEEEKIKKLLAREKEALEAEEKRLYAQQEEIEKQYRMELSAFKEKEKEKGET